MFEQILYLKINKIFLLIFFISIGTLGIGQSIIYPPFKGTAYKMMAQRKYQKFSKDFLSNPIIGNFEWDEINLPSRSSEKPFPDIEKANAFGIIFESKIKVTEDFHYRFEITSDDGTLLWLDDVNIIENDYSDGMHMKDDTVFLRKGFYDLKIWYFQAYPTEYGIIFKSEPVEMERDSSRNITLENQVFFKYKSHEIANDAHSILDSICQSLKFSTYSSCTVEGHSDNIGPEKYNKELSRKRADAIVEYIQKNHPTLRLKFETIGYGFERPIEHNTSEEGRAKNRRVEIRMN